MQMRGARIRQCSRWFAVVYKSNYFDCVTAVAECKARLSRAFLSFWQHSAFVRSVRSFVSFVCLFASCRQRQQIEPGNQLCSQLVNSLVSSQLILMAAPFLCQVAVVKRVTPTSHSILTLILILIVIMAFDEWHKVHCITFSRLIAK